MLFFSSGCIHGQIVDVNLFFWLLIVGEKENYVLCKLYELFTVNSVSNQMTPGVVVVVERHSNV